VNRAWRWWLSTGPSSVKLNPGNCCWTAAIVASMAACPTASAATGDARLAELYAELKGYPGGEPEEPGPADVVVPLRYRLGDTELALFSITAVIGTPMDVTIEELAIESFYPADDGTARALWALEENQS
jgi:hypothetical protein